MAWINFHRPFGSGQQIVIVVIGCFRGIGFDALGDDKRERVPTFAQVTAVSAVQRPAERREQWDRQERHQHAPPGGDDQTRQRCVRHRLAFFQVGQSQHQPRYRGGQAENRGQVLAKVGGGLHHNRQQPHQQPVRGNRRSRVPIANESIEAPAQQAHRQPQQPEPDHAGFFQQLRVIVVGMFGDGERGGLVELRKNIGVG